MMVDAGGEVFLPLCAGIPMVVITEDVRRLSADPTAAKFLPVRCCSGREAVRLGAARAQRSRAAAAEDVISTIEET
jgi:hypothetical protein